MAAPVPDAESPVPVPANPPTASTGPSVPVSGEALTVYNEGLGRLVHDVRRACEAERAKAEGRARFHLGSWEDRSEHQQELDMRIGHAVANYALTENALTYGISCPSCAAKLDRANEERERAERAEAKLAVITTWARRSAAVDPDAILAVVAAETPAALAALGSEEQGDA